MITKPDEMIVGFQMRGPNDDQYKLGYATFHDGKKLRKEPSWNGWRNKKIEPETFKNELLGGFVLSATTRRSTEWFGNGRSVWRVRDPRGFVLEINSDNLQSMIDHCTIINGTIEEKCVWTWDSGNMALIPENSDLYKESLENSERLTKKVLPSKVKWGSTIMLQDGSEVIYMGKFNVYNEIQYSETNTYNPYSSHGDYSRTKKQHLIKYHENARKNIYEFVATIKIAEILEERDIPKPEMEDIVNNIIISNTKELNSREYAYSGDKLIDYEVILVSVKKLDPKELKITKKYVDPFILRSFQCYNDSDEYHAIPIIRSYNHVKDMNSPRYNKEFYIYNKELLYSDMMLKNILEDKGSNWYHQRSVMPVSVYLTEGTDPKEWFQYYVEYNGKEFMWLKNRY